MVIRRVLKKRRDFKKLSSFETNGVDALVHFEGFGPINSWDVILDEFAGEINKILKKIKLF